MTNAGFYRMIDIVGSCGRQGRIVMGMEKVKKFTGCLVGGAAGDALGYAVEFDREPAIFKRYGAGGIREYELSGGRAIISDDTQMTLFTAEGILLAKDPYDYPDYISSMHQACREWLYTQEKNPRIKRKIWLTDIPELQKNRAPGLTCLAALRSGVLASIYEPINNSKGCGGVMRVAPIGLYYSPERLDIATIDMMGAQAAALTHGHPLGYLPAAGLVHIVNRCVYAPEMNLRKIVEEMIEVVSGLTEIRKDAPGHCETFRKLMTKAADLSATDLPALEAIHMLGEGWVGEEALAIAVYCALKYEKDFDAALIASVNHKGDSDSTGAVTGNILGAYLGADAIPDKYKEHLELLEVIEKVARRLAE